MSTVSAGHDQLWWDISDGSWRFFHEAVDSSDFFTGPLPVTQILNCS